MRCSNALKMMKELSSFATSQYWQIHQKAGEDLVSLLRVHMPFGCKDHTKQCTQLPSNAGV